MIMPMRAVKNSGLLLKLVLRSAKITKRLFALFAISNYCILDDACKAWNLFR